jgi:hypothetical protein
MFNANPFGGFGMNPLTRGLGIASQNPPTVDSGGMMDESIIPSLGSILQLLVEFFVLFII